MATAQDFPVDTNVQSASNKKRKGVVIGNKVSDGDQVVAVEWADGSLSKVNVNDLQKCLSLEEEFAAVQTSINEKLNQAADLISEAAQLARDNGKELQDFDDRDYDRLFEIDAVENAMDGAGWNTSSWHC